MLEAVDKVAEEHERNVRLFMLLLTGMRALDAKPADPAAVAESFLLKLLSLSGFHPALTTCAVCGAPAPERFASSLGGAVCAADADLDAGPASLEALDFLATLGGTGLLEAGDVQADTRVQARVPIAAVRLHRVPPGAPHEEPSDPRQEPDHVSSYLDDLDRDRLPNHVGIVMDGNGRWAKLRGLPRTEGHGAGEEALWDTVVGAHELGMGWLTVFAFSTENWKRPKAEVAFLMGFNRGLLRRRRDELHRMNVRVRFLGRRDWRVPRSVLKEMEISEELTAHNTGMTLTIAFNYGGRVEIVDAVKRLIADHDAGRLKGEKLTPESISSRLYHPDMPDPDLIIRTSGEERISNFLLWQAAYSELWFTPVYWPDFDREHLYEAIRDYQKRSRRFGAIAENDAG